MSERTTTLHEHQHEGETENDQTHEPHTSEKLR
jgi:hypothetical protein